MKTNKHAPPRWADHLLSRWCSPDRLEEIQGDLHEAFHQRCQEGRHRIAALVFVIDVMRSLSLKNHPVDSKSGISPSMLRSYVVIGSRNLMKNKVFSLINMLGLSIGMAACFLILQYVQFERSYDSFHEKKDRIYRVTLENITPNSIDLMATNSPGVGPALKIDFPEVERYARLVHQSIIMGETVAWSHTDGQGKQKVLNESKTYCADSSFLTMFDFPFIYGDPSTALRDPTSVVLSETEARKFFGSDNPLGKTLVMDGWKAFTVTGVFRDIPENSHIHFDMLVSYFFQPDPDRPPKDLKDEGNWRWAEFFTYIQLAPQTDPKKLESKLDDFILRYASEVLKRLSFKQHFHLQPLNDIHLRSPQLTKEREIHGSEQTVYFLLIVAVLILVVAWINYINLSTSRSIDRAREVGVRKLAGASRGSLIIQFLLESAVVNLLAIALSILIIAGALPFFNQLTGKNIGRSLVELSLLQEPAFWLSLVTIFFAGSFFSGLYPAFVLSSLKVASVTKGKFSGSGSGANLRKVLVGFQFAISVALIAGTLTVYRQLSYIQSASPGYSKDQLLVLRAPRLGDSTLRGHIQAFQAELKRNSNIRNVAISDGIPGRPLSFMHLLRRYDDPVEDQFLYYMMFVNPDFLNTFGIRLLAGRNLKEGEHVPWTPDDRTVAPILLNEKAIRKLRYDSPEKAIDQLVYFGLGATNWVGKIVGVVENYHQRTLHEDYDPIVFFPAYNGDYVTVNMQMNQAAATIAFIEDQYKIAFPGNSFEYFFLEDYVNRQYASDTQFGKVFGLFSALAIVVAALGLFGLSTFMITQRTKEIAIRKVLGATLRSMIYLFSGNFIKLILVANIIALPFIYWLATRWLDSFAFHTSVGWLVFIVPAILLFLISIGTVVLQTTRAGFVNPAKSLKVE